jgi:truncated hemoglobin YjbI
VSSMGNFRVFFNEDHDIVLRPENEHGDPREASEWYAAVGGDQFFRRLAIEFYTLVEFNATLAPLFKPPMDVHAGRLLRHFKRMYGRGDLREAWNPRLLQAHSHFLITHQHRREWINLLHRAGHNVNTPEPWLSQLIGVMQIASGDLMAASRGAALQRGEAFDHEGTRLG